MLKEELDQAGTEYDEVDLSKSPDKWFELELLTGGDRTTPVMVTGDSVEVGFHGIG
jgi:glutaredoxin